MRTVLGATLVTTIPVLMRLWLGSYGYALPQTPLEPSFQPRKSHVRPHPFTHPPPLLRQKAHWLKNDGPALFPLDCHVTA